MNDKPVSFSPVVRKLEELLERAKKGEIDSIAVAYTYPSGGGFGDVEWLYTARAATLLGEIDLMKFRFMAIVRDVAEESK